MDGNFGDCSSPKIIPVILLTLVFVQWKSFDFFAVTQVEFGDDETRLFFESHEISCVCSGSDSLFVGSSDGFVRIIGPSWKIVKSFQAHEVGTVIHMRQVEGTSLLVTVAVRHRSNDVRICGGEADLSCRKI